MCRPQVVFESLTRFRTVSGPQWEYTSGRSRNKKVYLRRFPTTDGKVNDDFRAGCCSSRPAGVFRSPRPPTLKSSRLEETVYDRTWVGFPVPVLRLSSGLPWAPLSTFECSESGQFDIGPQSW